MVNILPNSDGPLKNMTKGIVLAGGRGSRLYPITKAVSKQLLPVYDKPMIYYPLSVLMLADIRDILIITTPEDAEAFQRLLGDGSNFGINLTYTIQTEPNGVAEAFIIGREFIGESNVCLILGDNIFYGPNFRTFLSRARHRTEGATVFGYQVKDPERFGVVELDSERQPTRITEKPNSPQSNWALTGLYFFDQQVADIAAKITRSKRGEKEITSVLQQYLDRDSLAVETLGRGFAWLDTGTCSSLLEAAQFVETVEKRQGYKVACLEEIAYSQHWITTGELVENAHKSGNQEYADYLISLVGSA